MSTTKSFGGMARRSQSQRRQGEGKSAFPKEMLQSRRVEVPRTSTSNINVDLFKGFDMISSFQDEIEANLASFVDPYGDEQESQHRMGFEQVLRDMRRGLI